MASACVSVRFSSTQRNSYPHISRHKAMQSEILSSKARTKGLSSAQSTSTPLARIESISFSKPLRSDEHTSELQSLMRTSYAAFCLKKINTKHQVRNAQLQEHCMQ